jgi:hypothetical protein
LRTVEPDDDFLSLVPFGQALSVRLEHVLQHVPQGLRDWLNQVWADDNALLNKFYAASLDTERAGTRMSLRSTIVIPEELAFELPAVPGFGIAFGSNGGQYTTFDLTLTADINGPKLKVILQDIGFGLGLPTWLLKRVVDGGGTSDQPVAITLFGNIAVDQDLNVSLTGFDAFSLPHCIVGDSGVEIWADNVSLDSSGKSVAIGEVGVKLPEGFPTAPELVLQNARIDRHGVSGEATIAWDLKYVAGVTEHDGLVGRAVGTLFDAFSFGMREVSLRFERNALTRCEIHGLMVIPSMSPGPLDVAVSVGAGGEVSVAVGGLGDVLTLSRDQLFELKAESLGFRRTTEEVAFTASGDFRLTHPTVVEFIPAMGIKGFTVFKQNGGDWQFRVEGGSVKVNKSFELFGVARVDVTDVVLGRRDNKALFGITGGVALLEGIDAGAWVDGLRMPFTLQPFQVEDLTLDGIGVRVAVPDTFEFQGAIKKKDEPGKSYFEGDIALDILPVKMGLRGFLKVGKSTSCRFGLIGATLNIPGPGWPLGSLPLYVRSIDGINGINVTPDANGIREYFPLGQRQPLGLSHAGKWRDQCDDAAIGLGVGLATANPKLFTMKALLVYLFRPKTLLIEGKAWVLTEPKGDPLFYSIIALDIDDLIALINISAKGDFFKGVLSVDGMMEAYYGPDDADPSKTTSYFALGQKKPYFAEDRLVTAKYLKLFTGNGYIIIVPGEWAIGASIGLPKKSFDVGFASVHFRAHMGGTAVLTWGPTQFKGTLELDGAVGFRVLGKGFDLSLGANVKGQTPDWLIDALLMFGVRVNLGFKKVEYDAELPFHWEKRRTPRIGKVLDKILLQHPVTGKTVSPLLTQDASDRPTVPVVEPDMCPAIAFRFPVKDRTGLPFGQNVGDVPKHKTGAHEFLAELPAREGDDWTTAGIVLERMPLAQWPSGTWESFEAPTTASSAEASAAEGRLYMFGAWQADQAPDGTEGATHLHLFARTPFDFNRMNRLSRVFADRLFETSLAGIGLDATTAPILQGSSTAATFIKQTLASNATLGSSDAPLVSVPAYTSDLKDDATLRGQNRPLPHRGAQVSVIEDPTYPRAGVKMDSCGQAIYEDGKPVPADDLSEHRCANFLGTAPRFYSPKESVLVNYDGPAPSPVTFGGDVMIGGYARQKTTSRAAVLGTCEVFRDRTTPHDFRTLFWHSDRGITERAGPVVFATLELPGVLKVALRARVRRLVIHYQTESVVATSSTGADSLQAFAGLMMENTRVTSRGVRGATTKLGQGTTRREPAKNKRKEQYECTPAKPFLFRGAYRKGFSVSTFWAAGVAVSPAPTVDTRVAGKVVITARTGAPSFNEVVFGMCGSAKILSLCYDTDVGDDVTAANEQLDTYVDILFPRRVAAPATTTSPADTGTPSTAEEPTSSATGGGPGSPPAGAIVATAGPTQSWIVSGPAPLNAWAFTNDTPGVVPGFVYRLTVRTEHSRLKEKVAGPQRRNYFALFQVQRPPSDLAAYVLDAFPDESGFPHYKSCEHYVRFSRNYVHKLMGDLNGNIEARLLVNGDSTAPKSTLPFRDGADADLTTLLTPSPDEKKGWGWGKADGHLTTTEEATWIRAFNRTAPTDQQVQPSMALPDDMLWAYVANPVRQRADFTGNSTDTIAGFALPTDGVGATTSGRWSTRAALLRHAAGSAPTESTTATAADSYLLSSPSFNEGIVASAWMRPHVNAGHASLIVAADMPAAGQVGHHFALRLDFAGRRVVLLEVTPGTDPDKRVLGERRFDFVANRWYRVIARFAIIDGGVAVTTSLDDQQLFSIGTEHNDLSGHAGFAASADFSGCFDSLEVLSINRLNKLPESGVPNQLSIVFKDANGESEMYRRSFTPSLYLDLFDHLNSWDRRVYQAASGPVHSGCDPDPTLRLGVVGCDLTGAITTWDAARENLITALGDVYYDKREYVLKLRTLADLDATLHRLRDCRYDLDVAFEDLASKLGFELAAQPTRFEFILAYESRGILIQCPEPIDWTRIVAGEIKRIDVDDDGSTTESPAAAMLVYSSDFTRAILLLTSDGTTVDQFDVATTYLWTIKQNFVLPPHLGWLSGWVTHRKETHVVTLETPGVTL